MKFYLWHSRYEDGFCSLGALENVPADEEILEGKPRASGFPPDAFYEMRAEYPKDVEIPDNIYAMIHDVVSARLWAVLEPLLGASRVEHLPVKIKNHKGRFARGEYFILNPLDVLDAIDVAASKATFTALDPTQIATVERLVWKPLPEDVTMFRPHNLRHQIVIREDLVQRLQAANLKGLAFRDPDIFRG